MARGAAIRFWRERSAREQLVLGAGIAIVLALLGYGWLWQPMVADLDRLDEQLPRLRAQAEQMQRAGDEIARLRARPPGGAIDPSQLAALITRSAASHQLTGLRIAPETERRGIQVSMDRARFNAWLAWIDELHRTHRLVVTNVRVHALDAPGMVRIEAEFAPASGRK